ncbi:hypothetical protein UA08_00644 [Talaromyces atroroseus]|uniref:Uncharacterized protein n=1 Tax=Talaromyces atroroseus TaxID=1441469 RepID=A0A225AZ24_TALAT|nr:hypothetical protein UA08_00644 [Talaromyces atroroseus]OKL63704.1 hypothetical protein UA08_00644 [Talaromyces atroroseus]
MLEGASNDHYLNHPCRRIRAYVRRKPFNDVGNRCFCHSSNLVLLNINDIPIATAAIIVIAIVFIAFTGLEKDAARPLSPDLISGISNSLFGHGKYGISYTAYNDDGTCKTQDQVDSDMAQLRQFAFVRFYGVDCNQAQTISKAARGNNMQVFAGVFDIQNMNNDLQKIIDAADGDWSTFHTVSVGNELVNRGQSSPAEVIGAVNSARNRLRQAGYQGPVVTVDTFNQIIAHPELCDASDYCAANCHAFFDSNQTAENAGPYVLEQARQVSQAMKDGNKGVIITETGWPSAGEANGAAVPSRHNQIVALKSLKQSFPDGGVVFFSAFNEKWKQDNAWTFGTEKNWGLFDFSDTKDAISEILNPLKGNGV